MCYIVLSKLQEVASRVELFIVISHQRHPLHSFLVATFIMHMALLSSWLVRYKSDPHTKPDSVSRKNDAVRDCMTPPPPPPPPFFLFIYIYTKKLIRVSHDLSDSCVPISQE